MSVDFSPQRPIRILVVDDHPLMRDGIVSLIDSEPDMNVVAQAGNGIEAIECFRKHLPDVTLMDLQMAKWTASPRPGRCAANIPLHAFSS